MVSIFSHTRYAPGSLWLIRPVAYRLVGTSGSFGPSLTLPARWNPIAQPGSLSLVVNLRQTLKLLPLHIGEECTATGGDVRHLVREAKLLHCLGRFSPTNNRHCVTGGHRFGHAASSTRKCRLLEPTHRTIPNDGGSCGDFPFEQFDCLGPDVHALKPCGDRPLKHLRLGQ